jgi:hypothetical protein
MPINKPRGPEWRIVGALYQWRPEPDSNEPTSEMKRLVNKFHDAHRGLPMACCQEYEFGLAEWQMCECLFQDLECPRTTEGSYAFHGRQGKASTLKPPRQVCQLAAVCRSMVSRGFAIHDIRRLNGTTLFDINSKNLGFYT